MTSDGLRLSTRLLALKRDVRDRLRLARADAAFVSFPKSGRTYVRVMLSHLYQRRFGIDPRSLLEFDNYHRIEPSIPRILFTHDGDSLRRTDEFSADKSAYARAKVVLLARHPLDLIVSRYFHLKHRSRDATRRSLAELPIERFAWTELGGVPSIVAFLNAWAKGGRSLKDYLVLSYEGFRTEPGVSLAQLASFFGVPAEPEDIDEAVKFASFDNLKAKERDGYFASDRIGARQGGEAQSFKVREGAVSGYRRHFDPEERRRLERYVDDNLDPVFRYRSQNE